MAKRDNLLTSKAPTCLVGKDRPRPGHDRARVAPSPLAPGAGPDRRAVGGICTPAPAAAAAAIAPTATTDGDTDEPTVQAVRGALGRQGPRFRPERGAQADDRDLVEADARPRPANSRGTTMGEVDRRREQLDADGAGALPFLSHRGCAGARHRRFGQAARTGSTCRERSSRRPGTRESRFRRRGATEEHPGCGPGRDQPRSDQPRCRRAPPGAGAARGRPEHRPWISGPAVLAPGFANTSQDRAECAADDPRSLRAWPAPAPPRRVPPRFGHPLQSDRPACA
jgi:hypothetical protein